jgi:hypothetical protein
MRVWILLLFFSALLPAQHASHSALLTWSWSQGDGGAATGFYVKRAAVSGGPYTTVGIAAPTSLSYLDLSASGNVLTPGVTYYWVITAFNDTRESDPTAEAVATIPSTAHKKKAVVIAAMRIRRSTHDLP